MTPSVYKAVLTFSCELGNVVAFLVEGRCVGAGGRFAAYGLVIVGTFAQKGLIVGGRSHVPAGSPPWLVLFIAFRR